jgi:2-hydroxycyclohexanecarboxyl-CoA dehydrogenase
MNLDNRLALITGAASGIGLTTAQTFAEAGAHVLLADINEEDGEAAAASIRDNGFEATFARLDVTDDSSISACKKEVLTIKPQLDILAHVAGWGKVQPFVDNTEDFWRDVVNLNLMGVIAVTRAFIDGMIENEAGKIIVVASDAGKVGSLGETVYSAAKGGAIAFTKGLAREMARYNINVNSVCPGPTDTPLLAAVPDKFKEAFVRATPMRRLARPQEVADAVLFLASDRSSFITGQALSVNGGLAITG